MNFSTNEFLLLAIAIAVWGMFLFGLDVTS